jgi:hypothetical protein
VLALASRHDRSKQEINRMPQYPSAASRRFPLALCSAILLGASLSGCMSGAERRHVNLQEDANTCDSFGSERGSRAYNDCMTLS